MGPSRWKWCISEHKNRLGPSRQTRCISEHRPDWDPPGRHRQTWCISEHRNRLRPIQTDTERCGALVSTKTDQDPSGRHKRHGALVSTETDSGSARQTQADVVH